jgi:hypothetical protein
MAWAPQIPTWLSLAAILGTLTVAVVAGVLKTRGDARRVAVAAPTLSELRGHRSCLVPGNTPSL